MNIFGAVAVFFAAQPASGPWMEPVQADPQHVAEVEAMAARHAEELASQSPEPRPGGADQALANACSCGADTRCDPFAGLPDWPGPDAAWVMREDAVLRRLARFSRRYGPREAARLVFTHPGGMPPTRGSTASVALSPAAQTRADTSEPQIASEAI